MHSHRVNRSPHRLALLPIVALLAIAAGCDRGSTEPDDHGEPATLELRDHATGDLLAIYDGTSWDAALPHLHSDEETAVRTTFRDEDGDVIPLGGEFTANAMLAAGSPQGVVALTAHGDHIDIEALAEGTVFLIFQLYHGSHADWDAGPIALEVEDHLEGG